MCGMCSTSILCHGYPGMHVPSSSACMDVDVHMY